MNTEINEKCKSGMSELGLAETYVPDVPNDIIFPDELNAYLRDQVQYLTHENGMLKKNLTETETLLKNERAQGQALTKQLKEYIDVPSGNFSSISNIASSKIVELSKKLREKSSELESMRSKYTKLEHQLLLFQQKEEEKCAQVEKEPPTINSNPNLEEEMKQLNDKLNSVSTKLFDAKNINFQLKNDLKLANRLLQQEIGETFDNLQMIINNGNNWRGRAQIICDLQQKNSELREKLKLYQERRPEIKASESSTTLKYDRRIDVLSKENLSLKSDLHELKKRLDGSRARSKALESENSVLKTRASMLAEQQENDRDLIATLTSQLSTIKNVQSDDIKQKDQMLMKLQHECKILYTKLSKEQCKHEHMKREFEEKLSVALEAKNQQLNRPPSQHSNIPIDDKGVARLETERIRLLELTQLTNKRLEEERKVILDLQLQLKTERQKNAKLESKIGRLELDHTGRQSSYSLNSSKTKDDESSLRDKLELAEENIKALKTRLEMEQRERQIDFQEFSQILKNYTPISSEQNL